MPRIFQQLRRDRVAPGREREIYERSFVRTVLRLNGIAGTPTNLQLAKGRKILKLYDIKAAIAGIQHAPAATDAAAAPLAEPAAVEHAFLFVRFDSVDAPDGEQMQALNEWLVSQELH